MKKKLLFLFTLAALLGALCFSAGAIKADRPYKESKTVKIIDHVVYEYRNSPNQRPKKHYAVIDYFDTDEAANDPKIAKTVKIEDKIGKVPVTEISVNSYDEFMETSVDGGCASPYTKRIVLPDSVTRLNSFAFAGFCFSSFTLPERFTVIPTGTFAGCMFLNKLTVSEQLTAIDDMAFKDCIQLRKFNFPDTLKRIGSNAFRNAGLYKVSLPSDTSCGEYAFSHCSDLKKVTFREPEPENEKRLVIRRLVISEGQFEGSWPIQTVVFPKTIDQIYILGGAFKDCENLKTIRNISKVKRIGSSAFEHCQALETFTIPKGIECVHPYAFLSCIRLKTLYLNSANPNLLYDSLLHYQPWELFVDGNFIDFLRNDCMIYVHNADMLRMVQEEALHSKAEIAV